MKILSWTIHTKIFMLLILAKAGIRSKEFYGGDNFPQCRPVCLAQSEKVKNE